MVLVIHAGKTANKAFLKAVDELNRTKAKIIGVVLNEVKADRGDRYYHKSSRVKYIGY